MSATLERFDLDEKDKLLIYGIGNVGRQDDGLGVRLVEKLFQTITQDHLRKGVALESNYQLGIEDALLISEYDVVLFVDATRENPPVIPFSIRSVKPSAELSFTTHSMSIPSVLSLCDELYGSLPRAYCLTVPGYEWEIAEHLSSQAGINLDEAFNCLRAVITKPVKEVLCTSSL